MAKIKIKFEDVEHETVEGEDIVLEKISASDQEKIVRQIEKEYQLAWKYLQPKLKVWLARLKLYNNQRRDADLFGDPLMFGVFNTIHASLWDDRLEASWEGRGGRGDEDVEENLNALSRFDYDVMQKAQLDYDWNWDTEFFGRGLLLAMDFDRTEGIQAPVPEVIDPATWLRDPRATSINGDMRSKGAMRFGGREIGLTYWEIKNNSSYFNVGMIKKGRDINSLVDDAVEARRQAQGTQNYTKDEEALGKYENYEFKLLEWFTHFRGVKYLVTLANSRGLVMRMQKLKDQDKFPIIDRALYPMAHDWDGVSIPDLTEDKQRFRAVILNLIGIAAKVDVMPNYLYDQTKIKNKNDLDFRTNKFIPVDGRVDNAILAIQKPTVHQYVDSILNILDLAAQKATATSEVRQGVTPKSQRTLGERNLVEARSDTRYSMSAKLYGISEGNFWKQWYKLYKIHFKDKIDEKVIRIQGATAPIWRPLMRDNIISRVDPDVKIESKVISEQKRLLDREAFNGFAALVIQDPSNNRRFIYKRLGKLYGLMKEELALMFPPTVDELQAEDENVLLNQEKTAQISIQDDHATHLEIHTKANPNPYTIAHIRQHKKLMIEKRNRPDLFPPPQIGGFDTSGIAGGVPAGAFQAAPTSPTQ